MECAEETCKGHGRLENRKLEATDILRDYLDWPGVEQVCRIERTRIIAGKERKTEIVHAITSLSKEKASAEDLLRLSRAHWGIENRLFCVRDVSFREDQCRVRKGSGPQVLAAIRNAAITLLRRLGHSNIAAALRHYMMNYVDASRLVLYGRIE